MAASSFGYRKASTDAAAPAAAPSGATPFARAATIALLMARLRYASVRSAGNCPTWLRAISSQAYSFHRTVDVGAAHGDCAVFACEVAPGRMGVDMHAARIALASAA